MRDIPGESQCLEAGPHLDIDVTVVLSGLDIISALLIFPQHGQTKVLYEISELFSWRDPALVLLMVVVVVAVTVLISTIAKNAWES